MTARRRAAAWAGAVTLGWSALMLALYFAIAALRPDWGYAATATATLAGLALVLVVWLWRGGLWAAAGLARVRPDRPALLILPLLLALVPLAAGVAPVEAPILAVMVAGYALTGFVEEGMFRGILLDRLRPQGEHFAAAVTAVLFGLMHLGNILMRGQLAPILGQVVGAACFGFGYAALRLRTGTLWPLVGCMP
ncbi:MAG: CPBP family intramembrane metalloprotease [Rhodobacteraceae bacterium]|nr:CPBP family intramembrane metalloprotease [Paracoccaceae bacterium]